MQRRFFKVSFELTKIVHRWQTPKKQSEIEQRLAGRVWRNIWNENFVTSLRCTLLSKRIIPKRRNGIYMKENLQG